MTDWLLVFGMMLVTFIPRYLPFAFVDHFKLPPLLMQALAYIPIAVLSAIVAQNVFFLEGQLALSVDNNRILTAVVAVVIAMATKKLSWTVIGGFIVFLLLQNFFPA